jgi:hypothetical protein
MATSAKKPAVPKQAVSKSMAPVVEKKAAPKNSRANPVAKETKPVAAVSSVAKRKTTVGAPVADKGAKKSAPRKTAAKKVDNDAVPTPSKFISTAATPGIKSALNPANAWPFPTGARPR